MEIVNQNLNIPNSATVPVNIPESKRLIVSVQNRTITTTAATTTMPLTVTQSSPAKKVFKCLDKNGKIITVGLMVDPAKMKNIKIIKLPAATTTTTTSTLANKLVTISSQNVENQKTQGTQSNVVLKTFPKTVISNASTPVTTPKIIKIIPNTSALTNAISANTSTIKKIMILPKKNNQTGTISTNKPIYHVTKIVPNPLNIGTQSISIAGTSSLPSNTIPATSVIRPTISKVVMRNGQIFLANTPATEKLQTKPKQESLLKPKPPQISLLKSNFNTIAKSSQLSNELPVLRENNLKTIQTITKLKLPQDYVGMLRRKFLSITKFTGMRSAIEFLLKYTPLINPLATNEQYHKQFLFVVENMVKFHSLSMVKRQSNEVRF